jgi:predicted DNA binding protein
MKKELMLITSYTPDFKREELLRTLVKQIDRSVYDIMVVSHSFIPSDIMNNIDYFHFEKELYLMYDMKDRQTTIFGNSMFRIHTSEAKNYNHGRSFLRLLKLGMSNAKNLGYKKVHFYEYDSEILDFSEIVENSSLLDEHAHVYYVPKGLPWPNSPISFNLDLVSHLWFDLSDEDYLVFLDKTMSKISEEYEMRLINDGGKSFVKKVSEIDTSKIKIGLRVDHETNRWHVPIYNKNEDTMMFFGWNEYANHTQYTKVIVNDKHVFNFVVTPRNWVLNNVAKFGEVETMIIIVDGVVKYNNDFKNTDIDIFKLKNNVDFL